MRCTGRRGNSNDVHARFAQDAKAQRRNQLYRKQAYIVNLGVSASLRETRSARTRTDPSDFKLYGVPSERGDCVGFEFPGLHPRLVCVSPLGKTGWLIIAADVRSNNRPIVSFISGFPCPVKCKAIPQGAFVPSLPRGHRFDMAHHGPRASPSTTLRANPSGSLPTLSVRFPLAGL
jgi:hypothetical protein